MQPFQFSVPQNIVVGRGSLARLPELASKIGGTHALLITGPHLRKMGAADRAADSLRGAEIQVDIFSDVEGNPSVETVERAVEAFHSCAADCIVAFGGGSPMDVAKAAAVVAKYGGKVTDYEGAHKVPGKTIPMICIPTTAGTGSEVTAFSVITDHSRNYKFTIFSYEILPQYAILDAELLTTAPASVAAACGMDAFIHAEEAYVSKAASPFSDAMAEKAMELIGGHIRRYTADRGDIEAAEAMLVGSLFAGIAFSFARLGNVHAMSHPVSAFFHVSHGVANAVLLPTVVEYNALADQGRYHKIYNWISRKPVSSHVFQPAMLADAVRLLNKDLGIPEDLLSAVQKSAGDKFISEEDLKAAIPAMAVDAMKSGNIAVNPRSSVQRDIEQLYLKAMKA